MDPTLYSSALRAIAFFDIFDHPLTDRELFEYLHTFSGNAKLNFSQFVLAIQDFSQSQAMYTQGMWHLPGRESLILKRTERSTCMGIKLHKLSRAVRLFRHLPFVRSVFVCNTLAFSAADHDSDIDVLIVVKSGRMWTARIFATLIMSVTRLRRTRRMVQNRICLSFYLADRKLNISKFRITDDVYLSYWLRTLIPVYDPDHLGDSMLRANQEILSPFVRHARYVQPSIGMRADCRAGKSVWVRFFESVFSDQLGDRLEGVTRSFQRKKIMRNPKSLVHAKDTRVVVNDSVLKFHENDRRALYRDLWKKRLKDLGIPHS